MTTVCVYCGGNAESGCGAVERDGGRYEHYSKIECAEVLRNAVFGYRKILWVLARREGLSLHIPKADLATIPPEAELLQWDEPMFDAVMLKGICSPINQPDLAKSVHHSSEGEKTNG